MSSSPRDEAQTIISHLAEIGLRYAGSPQEATAAAFMNARLRRVGMGVTTHPLLISSRRRRLYGAAAICGLFAALTAIVLPLPSLLLALAAILVLLADAAVGPLVQLGPRHTSQTIIGTQAIASGGMAGRRDPRWRLILLAPLDSPVMMAGLSALAGRTRAAALARVAALAMVMGAALIEQLRPNRGWALLAIPATILLGLQVMAVLRGPRPAPHDGAATAMAAMLLAAQQLRDLRQVELWAVAVGATSLDAGGVDDLLRAYPFDRASTLAVVIDQLAGDQLRANLRPRGADHALASVAAAAASAQQISLGASPAAPDLHLAEPLLRKGMPTVTLYGQATPGAAAPPSPAQLSQQAAGLIAEIVRRLEGPPAD